MAIAESKVGFDGTPRELRKCDVCGTAVKMGDLVDPIEQTEYTWFWFSCFECAASHKEPIDWKEKYEVYYAGKELDDAVD